MKFVKIIIDKNNMDFRNTEYLVDVISLYERFSRYLYDDYFLDKYKTSTEAVIKLIARTSPYFWVIIDKKTQSFTGFGFLENFVGEKANFHSAEVTTCFEPAFWGKYTKICAKKFVKYCFKNYGLKKLKALVFSQNTKVQMLLKEAGFQKEAVLKAETIKNGQFQDIDVYSIIN